MGEINTINPDRVADLKKKIGRRLTLGSLFDGSGGFPLGGALAGIDAIWASEIEPFPIRVTTKRFPDMKHLGDVSKINGAEVEPVDIITFGSPCQDISLAGRRAGLAGAKSCLFHQAVRIIKEMREATDGVYPTYAVWENVYGAFSSNKGEDFRTVIEETCRIADPDVSIPRPPEGKWRTAGCIMGDGYSVAWRCLDAQFWGVPQRRRRIYLVTDFRGQRAPKILFESESVSRYSEKSGKSWQAFAAGSEGGTRETGGWDGVAFHLNTRNECINLDDKAGSVLADQSQKMQTFLAVPVKDKELYEVNGSDYRYKGPLEKAPTVLAYFGTGGNNTPYVVHTNNSAGDVAYGLGYDSFNQGYNAAIAPTINKEVQPPLVATGPSAVAHQQSFDGATPGAEGAKRYVVRRLTPTECARLQGFPDWWCSDLDTPEPSDEDMAFWQRAHDVYHEAVSPQKKPSATNQIRSWLKHPRSDSAEYKMWGNGVALPCVYFVMCGIAWADSQTREEATGA